MSRWDTEAFLDRHNARLPYTRRMPEEDRRNLAEVLIPIRVQDEPNSLVWRASGFVARSLQPAAGMRLAGASPATRHPSRLSLILNAHWNQQPVSLVVSDSGPIHYVVLGEAINVIPQLERHTARQERLRSHSKERDPGGR